MVLSTLQSQDSPSFVFESYTGQSPEKLPTYTLVDPPALIDKRARGDEALAQALGARPFDHPRSGPDSLFNIPADSTLGVWLNQLDQALRHPDFKHWMKQHALSPTAIRFDPVSGTLTASAGGKPKTFSLADDADFRAVAGPLVQAVQALGFWPAPSGRSLGYAHKPYNVAHFEDVLRFYGVTPTDPTTTPPRFPSIADTDPVRGERALAEQQRQVGDIYDRHTLLDLLSQLVAKLPPPPLAPEVLARDLAALKLSPHPGSTYSQAHPSAADSKVSAAHFISASGAPVPKTLDAVNELIRTLRNGPLEQARASREKTRYANLLHSTRQALPQVRAEAKKWAEAMIFKLTGQQVDADTLYLNRFHGTTNSAPTITGWEHTDQEPSQSQKLPDALLSNFNEHDALPGELDLVSGVYTQGAGQGKNGGYGAHNQFALLPSALMHESWKTDFQAQITDKLASFWKDHGADYRTSLKGEFIGQARQQLAAHEGASPEARQAVPKEHRFTREDYRLVMQAAANVPLDHNEPLTVEQLQATAPVQGRVSTHVFAINGYPSTDILRFSAPDHRRQVLYVPGHTPAFLRFDSIEELDQWVAAQGKDPEKRLALEAHFSLRDRQDNGIGWWSDFKSFITGDRQSNKGVDTALANLGSDYWSKREGVVIDRGTIAVHGDLFDVIKDATQQRMTSDADVTIKSNSEIARDTWLNDVTAAAGLMAKLAVVGEPLVAGTAVALGLAETVLATEKVVSGDTRAERTQGVANALDGLTNVLFSYGGVTAPARVIEAGQPPIAVRQALFDGDTVLRYRNSRPQELTDLATVEVKEPVPVMVAPSLAHEPPAQVAMGESVTLSEGEATLATRGLSDCSALAVLTDWDGKIYRTRTLMHLTGSNLELGLLDGSTRRVLDRLQASLKNGGRVIFTGGVGMQSTQGMATVIGQTFHGEQPLKALLTERPGVSVTLANSEGLHMKADGTFALMEGTGKGVLDKRAIADIFERID